MKAYMDANNIDPAKVCYLTIAREPLMRIISGEKTVEFREYSDYYCRKFFKTDKDKKTNGLKPLSHLLLQGGYSAESPRTLIELVDGKIKDEDDTKPYSAIGKRMYDEAEKEGFEITDAWIGLALGKPCVIENVPGVA